MQLITHVQELGASSNTGWGDKMLFFFVYCSAKSPSRETLPYTINVKCNFKSTFQNAVPPRTRQTKCKLYGDFGQLRISIANVSETNQDIVNQKTI